MRLIAFDTETRLIAYPDEVNPRGICITYHDSFGILKTIYKLDRNHKNVFKALLEDPNVILVGHNTAFDLHVLAGLYPSLRNSIWRALQEGRIEDTWVNQKLYLLSTKGDCSAPCSLAVLAEQWLGEKVEGKEGEDIWRLRYGELEDVPLDEWPEPAVTYAVEDARLTYDVYRAQCKVRRETGPGSMGTRQLQVAAAYALRGMTIEGVRIDPSTVDRMVSEYSARHEAALETLKSVGLVRESGTRDQRAIAELAAELGVDDYTDTGRVKTDRKTLDKIQSDDPRYLALMEYSNTLKAVSTFLPQMGFPRVHPEYNAIVNTLRTSCRSSNYYKYKGQTYGKKVVKRGHALPSINFQQIPRDSDYRKAFRPEPGHVFITMDYGNLELICAAHTYYTLFGKSELRDVLNAGTNLHDVTGCLIYNTTHNTCIETDAFRKLVSESDTDAKFCRQSAKFVNLGCPGGQSARTIYTLANSIGLDITMEQATEWRAMARDRFPDFTRFFGSATREGYISTQEVGSGDYPYAVDMWGVYLARKSYTNFANAIAMQTPGALGVKRALVRLYHATQDVTSPLYGSSLKALVHDEFVMSVPVDRLQECMDCMADHMIDGMQQVVPSMRVSVEAMVQDYWGKEANGEHAQTREYHKGPRED